MEFTEEHYKKLLGLPDPWEVEGVKISIEEVRVDIEVGYVLRFSWNWKIEGYELENSRVEREARHDDEQEAVHRRAKGGDFEGAFVGGPSGLRRMRASPDPSDPVLSMAEAII